MRIVSAVKYTYCGMASEAFAYVCTMACFEPLKTGLHILMSTIIEHSLTLDH